MGLTTAIGLGGLALTAPGLVGSTASGVDNWFGTDLTRRKYRARRGLSRMADLGGYMATQGFDSAVDALALEAGLNSVPLNISGGTQLLGPEDELFLQQLIATKQDVVQQATQTTVPRYHELLSLSQVSNL